jgi:hypothetical protein
MSLPNQPEQTSVEKMIKPENFLNNLFSLYEETFETDHSSIYLDRNTSLLTTLETVSAEEASVPVGGKCASLAAQVTHVIFYLELLEKYFLKQEVGKVDWGEIWRTVEKISPEDWEALRHKLREVYMRLDKLFHNTENWNDEDTVGAALAIVVHTAYHLGEIRQALCTLK